jgi:hypothetical protein
MTLVEEKIIDTFLKDEELFKYVQRKVTKRLPPGPHLKSDSLWYKQVIDLTINEAFDDLQVKETLNHQISQLEKYLKKKSVENLAVADHGDANIDDTEREKNGNNENENMNPNFSFSEPIQQQPKQKRISKIKLLNHQNGAYITNKKKEKSDPILNNPESEHAVELEEMPIPADKSPSIDSSKKLKDGVNILNDLDSNGTDNNPVYPETQISGYTGDSLIDTRTSTENDLPLMLESTDVGSPIASPRSGNSYIYVYVYICLCMYIYGYIYMYICMYIYIYMYIHIYTYIYTYTYIYICIRLRIIHICLCIYIHVCILVYISIHICIYTRLYICICICINIDM